MPFSWRSWLLDKDMVGWALRVLVSGVNPVSNWSPMVFLGAQYWAQFCLAFFFIVDLVEGVECTLRLLAEDTKLVGLVLGLRVGRLLGRDWGRLD